MAIRNARAVWQNGLKDGKGRIQFANGEFDKPYSFSTRFEEDDGTNPEELIAAAHAGCYSMALAAALEQEGHAPKSVTTSAKVKLEEVDGDPAITVIELHTDVELEGVAEETFAKIAEDAKKNCPVSKALAGAEIKLSARLV